MATILDERSELLIEKTVNAVFLRLGIDVNDPDGIIEFQKDQHYTRAERIRRETSTNNTRQHIISMVLSGMVAGLFLYFFPHIRQ